jgi:hypothetical protein
MSFQQRIEQHAALFKEFCTVLQEAEQKLRSVTEREAALVGKDHGYLHASLSLDQAQIERAAEALAQEVVCAAITRFTRAGCTPIKIHAYAYRQMWKDNPAQFDPLQLWQRLEAQYGGENVLQGSYTQACQTLIAELHLAHHRRIEQEKNCGVLHQPISCERKSKGAVLGEHYTTTINSVLRALHVFLEWAQAGMLFYRVHEGDPVTSREHFALLDGKLELHTYFDRFEYHLEWSLVEQLQVFLSTHGPEPWRTAD